MKMKRQSVFVIILIFYHFDAISARHVLHPEIRMKMKMYPKYNADKWLDMSIEDLEMQCRLKNKESGYEILMSEFNEQLIKFMTPVEEQGIGESDFIFHHIYNPDLVRKLKKVISSIQNCLDNENRLDSEGIERVMERVLKAHAIKIVQLDPLRKEDLECIRSNTELLGAHPCADLLPSNGILHEMNIFHSLTMGSIKNSTCEDNLPFEECMIKYAKNCNSNVEKLIKALMSPDEIGMCENFIQKTHPDMIEDISDAVGRKKNHFFIKKILRL